MPALRLQIPHSIRTLVRRVVCELHEISRWIASVGVRGQPRHEGNSGGRRKRYSALRQISIPLTAVALTLLGNPAYADSPACKNYAEIRKAGHMSIGVNFDIPDPLIKQQFRYAMDFWASLLDMDWRRESTANCAIRVTSGIPKMFDSDDIALADDPDLPNFRGEIAFNSAFAMTPLDAYLVCIHEIGHLLGLDHNPSATSVMCAFEVEGEQKLEAADISALSARHRMRQRNNMEDLLPVYFLLGTEGRHPFALKTGQIIASVQVP